MPEYTWNFDDGEEYWRNDVYESVEKCIEEAITYLKENNDEYESIYVGQTIPFLPHVDAEQVLESIQEDAWEEVGELGEEWNAYDYKKKNEIDELSEALTKVVHEWMKKYGYYPSMFTIRNIKNYPLNFEVGVI